LTLRAKIDGNAQDFAPRIDSFSETVFKSMKVAKEDIPRDYLKEGASLMLVDE